MNTYTCCIEGKMDALDFQDIQAACPEHAAYEYLREQFDFYGHDVEEDIYVVGEEDATISKFRISAKVEHEYTEAL
ncbi:MAG: hypothetical protein LBQ10_01605 [Desulfovibrio sp.]|jgi:hypothetical protein|nr:hypothetical protein [Desulfovibrio sp.]